MMKTSKSGVFLPWIVCSLGALFYCYEYFLRILPSVMTQDLMMTFGISASALGNLVAFYYYAYTPMQFPVGILMDRYGPHRLLVFACFLCALGTYFFASHSLIIAQAGRFMVGIGSAFAFVGVLKLASLWLPPSRFAFIAGLATTLGMLGGMEGDIISAELVRQLGAQTTLYLSAIAGIVLMVCLWLFIPERHPRIRNQQDTAPTFKHLLLQVLVLCRNYQMWLVGVIGCLLYLSLTAFAELWGIPYLIKAYQLSNSAAAAKISMVFLGWAVGAPLVGWISDKARNRRLPLIIGAVLGCLAFSVIIYLPEFCTPTRLSWLLFLFGVFSSAQVVVFPIACEMNSPMLTSTAVAMTNFLVMIGGVVSQPLIGWFLDVFSKTNVQSGLITSLSQQHFQYVLSVIPVGFMVAAVLAFLLKSGDRIK